MTQQKTDLFIKVCMKAWLLCESCVHAEEMSEAPRLDLIRECSACARSCFTVVSKLVGQVEITDMGTSVVDCLIHCRQAATQCAHYTSEEDIRLCGDICDTCGNTMRELAFFSLN